MIKRLSFIPVVLISIIFSSCSTTSSTSSSSGIHPGESAILWHQTSAEYEALCYQAFGIAKQRVQMYKNGSLDRNTTKPIAVVMDLDETILDNSPYNASLVLNGEKFKSESWEEWVKKENAKMVPGALDFLNFLRDNSVKYYFISNRDDKHLKYTFNNLSKNGVEVSDNEIFLDNGTSKKDRRERIDSYEIVLLIGDNLADFDESFETNMGVKARKNRVQDQFKTQFGEKFIILPNPLYGDWEKALKNESRKREGQLELLRTK